MGNGVSVSRMIHPNCGVAVVATSDGRFTFQIFMVSSEPRTLQIGTRRYATPAEAAQAGYEAIALDEQRRESSGPWPEQVAGNP